MPVILGVGLVSAPVIFLLTLTGFGFGFSAILIAIGTAMYLGMPVAESYIITHTSDRKRSTVLGIYYLGSRGGPAIAPAIGYIIDHYGFHVSFTVVAISMVAVTLLCGLLLWGKKD